MMGTSAGAPPSAAQRSLLLGVDWGVQGVRERTTAIELTATGAFVVTEALPPLAAEVDLDLRLGKWPPVAIRGRVTQVRLSLEPGVPAGFAVQFAGSAAEIERVGVLVRATEPRGRVKRARALELLHVESNRLLRDMFAYAVSTYFGARGLEVRLRQASTVTEGLALLADGAPEAVVIEHDVDGGQGATVLRAASARLGQSAWIVGIGGDGAARKEEMLKAGADLYLRKPLVLRDLFYTMEHLFREEPRQGAGRGAA